VDATADSSRAELDAITAAGVACTCVRARVCVHHRRSFPTRILPRLALWIRLPGSAIVLGVGGNRGNQTGKHTVRRKRTCTSGCMSVAFARPPAWMARFFGGKAPLNGRCERISRRCWWMLRGGMGGVGGWGEGN